MSARDEMAAEAGRSEAEESFKACGSDIGRDDLSGEYLAKGFDLRRVVGRSPSNRDWRAFLEAADARLEELRAARAAKMEGR